MATNGSAPPAKPASKPAGGKKIPSKDETLAKVAGAVIAGGIVWSLFKSMTGRGKRQQVQTQDHSAKEAITEKSDALSKDAEHVSKELEHKATNVSHSANHVGYDFKHTREAAGNKISQFGHKKPDGKSVQVFQGDTLWGIAKKYNVSVEALMATNGIQNGDNISAGELIIVPK